MSGFFKQLLGSSTGDLSHLSVTNDPLINPISVSPTPDVSTVESVVTDTAVCQEDSKESAKNSGSKGNKERASNEDKNKRKRNRDNDGEYCIPANISTKAIHYENVEKKRRMAHVRSFKGKG